MFFKNFLPIVMLSGNHLSVLCTFLHLCISDYQYFHLLTFSQKILSCASCLFGRTAALCQTAPVLVWLIKYETEDFGCFGSGCTVQNNRHSSQFGKTLFVFYGGGVTNYVICLPKCVKFAQNKQNQNKQTKTNQVTLVIQYWTFQNYFTKGVYIA